MARSTLRRIARIAILSTVLLVAVPPLGASAWTRYRYAQGSTDWPDWGYMGWTTSYLDRQYNGAYRQESHCGYAGTWAVSYRKSPGNVSDVTWYAESQCTPTEIGQTTGGRTAWCQITSTPFAGPWAYNCDTTIP